MWSMPSLLRQPLVRLVLWRIVAKALSMGFEEIKGSMCIFAGLGLPDVVQHFPGLGLGALWEIIEDIASFVEPV